MTGVMVTIGVILLCVLTEGFFSGSEIAIVSSHWPKIRREAEKGDRRAALLLKLWRNPDRLLATTLVGTNVSVIFASVLATYLVVGLLTRQQTLHSYLAGHEEFLVTVCLLPVTLLFGEIIPKTVFQGASDRMARKIVYPMMVAWIVLYPLTTILTVFSGLIKKSARSRVKASPFVTREELAMVVRLRDLKTELKKHERRMIRRLFTFRETKVREVMVPLVNVVAFDEGATLEQVLDTFSRKKFTRYPVFRKKVFTVVGVLNVLSCLQEPNPKKRVARLMEAPYFIPENKSVVDLLREMEMENIGMAVAVDEYGGSVGIVTREDIIEEIVGELEDEHEMKKSLFRKIDESNYEIDAHLDIELVSEKLGIGFPPGDYETMAGFMISRLGRIPQKGELVMVEGLTVTASEVRQRTVEKVLISLPQEERKTGRDTPATEKS